MLLSYIGTWMQMVGGQWLLVDEPNAANWVSLVQVATTLPVIRSFRASNNVVLKDGQTRQFTAAADRITGEVVKVDVTLKVAK